MINFTEWFDIRDMCQRPKRKGVYQLRTKVSEPHYARWDGKKWCRSCRTAEEAEMQSLPSDGVAHGFYCEWRGLAAHAPE
jgi:hypothetical protein